MFNNINRIGKLGAVASWLILSASSAFAATINVPGDYATIQDAIDNAAPYDTIQVAAGTYNESITINIPLTLQGAQANVDPVEGGRTGGESTISNEYAVNIRSSDVTLNGFEIVNFKYGVNLWRRYATPDYTASNITLKYNYIHLESPSESNAFYSPYGKKVQNLLITHNIVDIFDTDTSAGSGTIVLRGEYENVEISYNIIQYVLRTQEFINSGLAIYSDSDVPFKTMVIKGNYFRGGVNIPSIQNGQFVDNILNFNGAALGFDAGTVSGNTFRGGAYLALFGWRPDPIKPTNNVVITNNNLTEAVDRPALSVIRGALVSTIATNINAFGIRKDIGALIENENNVDTLDATNNWWGSPAGPSANPPGALVGPINTTPFLISDTEDPAKLVPPTSWPLSLTETRSPGFWPLGTQETKLSYTGPTLDTDGDGTTVLKASLSSSDEACYKDQTVSFRVDGKSVGTATTDSSGTASLPASLASGATYAIAVEFPGTSSCLASSVTASVTVGRPASSAYGTGWYKPIPHRKNKASFEFAVKSKQDKGTNSSKAGGELSWAVEGYVMLKSKSITQFGYTKVNGYSKCAIIGGTGELRDWKKGVHALHAPKLVKFRAHVCDGGRARKHGKSIDKPDAFGMEILEESGPGESGLTKLSGGKIKVN